MRTLLFCAAMMVSTGASAQVNQILVQTDPNTGRDVVSYFEVKTYQGDLKAAEPRFGPLAYRKAADFGRCVVERDRARSVDYVRASAAGRESDAFRAIRDLAFDCRVAVAHGVSALDKPLIRMSAIADALR